MKTAETYCDVCGISQTKLGSHWSLTMEKVIFGFKVCPNIQSDLVIEDCCSICSKKLLDFILSKMGEIKMAVK